ncbi:MAG: hypothetical protein GQ582_00480 [Methyloprofundus sp.]|nr:hypothetical protein [Methyloprofundus sp.]
MSVYKTTKKVRYITSIIFFLFMSFIVGGSYLAQQDKAEPLQAPLENL